MDASQKKIMQLEFTVQALEELLAVTETLFLKESRKLEEVNEKLKESIKTHEKLENDIEQILDASSDAIRVIDMNYNIIYASKSFRQLYGHSEEIIGKKCYEVVPEKECFTEGCSLKRVIRTGKKFVREREIESEDGTKVPYSIDVIPYTDSNGELIGIIKNYRNITEHKRAEEKIRHINAIQDLILENSTLGIAFVRNRVFEWVNARVGELLMLPPEQIQGSSTRIIYPSDESYEELGRMAYPVLTGGGRSDNTLQLKRSDGTLFWCRFIGKALNPEKVHDGSVWMFEDRTEEKLAEEKIQHINAIQNLILENSTLGIALVSKRTFEWANARVGELLMLPLEQIQGSSTRIIYPSDESYEELGRMAYPRLTSGERSDNTLQLKRSDGTLFWCRFIGKALDPTKVHDGSVWMFEDITEAKEAQKLAEESAQQQGRIEMANNILHDIGNAMTGISSFILKPQMEKTWQEVESLRKLRGLFADNEQELINVLGNEKQQALNDFVKALIFSLEERNSNYHDFIKKMSAAVGHVCAVLDLQRHYLGEKTSPLATKINLLTIVNDTLVMMADSLEKRSIAVSLDARGEKLKVSGDQTRLARVFLNIIKNTCEAFDGTQSIDNRKLGITVSLDKNKKEVTVVFCDNAIGFTPKTGEKLFERGFSSKPNGSGIGLHECRSIIESHGGTISIESNGINSGAVTVITFPACK